jgi:DNA repair ATPase RecN
MNDNRDYDNREYDILDEYVDVTNKIIEIQGILDQYRQRVKQKLKRTKSEQKKKQIIKEFRDQMKQIKKSELITTKYKQLKGRQSEIRTILLSDSDSDSDFMSDVSDVSDVLDMHGMDGMDNYDIEPLNKNLRHSMDDKGDRTNKTVDGDEIMSLLDNIKNRIMS